MTNRTKAHKTIAQFVRYAIVGVMNTTLTLVVIFLCKSVLNINPYVSNAVGYVVGLINSFIWNRRWVFRSSGKLSHQAIHFLTGFAVCYAIQFAVVWLLNQSSFGTLTFVIMGFTLSGYGLATLIGNVTYTLANFAYNRMLTFK